MPTAFNINTTTNNQPLEPLLLKVGSPQPQYGVTREVARRAEPQAPPQTCWITACVFTRHQAGSWALSSLKAFIWRTHYMHLFLIPQDNPIRQVDYSPFTVGEAGSERLHAQCHRAEEPGFEPLLRGEAVLALLSCELRELAVGGFPPKGWAVGRSPPAGTPGPGNPALHR